MQHEATGDGDGVPHSKPHDGRGRRTPVARDCLAALVAVVASLLWCRWYGERLEAHGRCVVPIGSSAAAVTDALGKPDGIYDQAQVQESLSAGWTWPKHEVVGEAWLYYTPHWNRAAMVLFWARPCLAIYFSEHGLVEYVDLVYMT